MVLLEPFWEARFSGKPSGPRTRADGNAVAQVERWMWCSMSGAMRYWIGRDDFWMSVRTEGVRWTGLKTARPVGSVTVVRN